MKKMMVIWNKFRHNYFTLCVLGIDPRTIFILFLLQLLNLKLKNMRVFLFVLALLLNTWVGISQSADEKRLEEDLFALPDVSFTKISAANELPIKYMLRIKQPLDHKDRSKGEFYQRVILTHQGYQQPTLMQTQGYELYKGKNELEAALKANHLNIEHRYFGESVPDSIQWKYLTLEQVTADLHKINQLFKPMYKNKWISFNNFRNMYDFIRCRMKRTISNIFRNCTIN